MLLRFALATLLVALTAAPVSAQDYAEVKAKATSAFQAGNFDEAAVLFQEAFEIEPRGNLLYNIGLCYDKAGKTAEAVSFYQRYIEAVPNASRRPAVVRQIAKLKELLAGRYEQVSVTSSPPGAIIFVDDKSKGAMGAAPVEFKLLPGSYTIIAELDGHETAKRTIQLREGSAAQVNVRLIPSGQVGSVLVIVSEKGASVAVDGRTVGRAPLPKALRLPAGPHEITVSKPGFVDQTRQIEVAAGKEQRISVSLDGESGGGDIGGGGGGGGGLSLGGGGGIWPWVTMGVGVAAIGGGVFAGLSAQDLHDQLSEKQKLYDEDPTQPTIAQEDIDQGNTLTLMSNVLYGVGVAAIAGGVAWWLLGDSAPGVSGELRTSVQVDDNGAFIGVQGGF